MSKRKIRVPGYFEARATGSGPSRSDMLRAMKLGAARGKGEPSAIDRATALTAQDKRQRWVTTDNVIHVEPVPYRDAVSVRWLPIVGAVFVSWRPAALAHPSIGALS